MTVVLYMIWCLSGSCETIRDTVRLPSMMACAIYGQHRASDWQREHPAYAEHELRRWSCELGERT